MRYRRMARMARSAARTAARANAWTAQGRGGTPDSRVPPRRRRVSIGPGGECGGGWSWEREHTDWYGAAHNARAVHRRGARIAIFDDFPSLSRENKRARIDRATGGVPGRAAWRVRTARVLASRNHRSRAPTCTTAGATAPGAPGGRVAPPDFIKPHTHTHAHTWAHGATRGASSDAAWRVRTACVVAITPVQSWPRERTAAAPTTISRTRALRLSETQKLRNTHTHTYPDRATAGVPGRAAWRVRTACVLASRNHRS